MANAVGSRLHRVIVSDRPICGIRWPQQRSLTVAGVACELRTAFWP